MNESTPEDVPTVRELLTDDRPRCPATGVISNPETGEPMLIPGPSGSPGTCDQCGKPSTRITTPGAIRLCDEHGGSR